MDWKEKYLNKIVCGDCLEVMKELPDKSIDLIIADPPYWKVVSKSWDYQWRTMEEYLDWCSKWMQDIYKYLRYGGTLYLFGYPRVLSYQTVLLESFGFELRQEIIVEKGIRAISGRATRNYKMFPHTTEHIFLFIKDNKRWLKPFLKSYQQKKGYTSKQINKMLGVTLGGGGMWSIYTGKNVCEQFPTEKMWDKLKEIFGFTEKYQDYAQVFNTIMGITNVWTDIDFYEEKRFHPTQKPERLINRLISASSNIGDIVLDPFVGSSTTCVAAKKINRKFIGIDSNPDYCEIARKRLEEETTTGGIF